MSGYAKGLNYVKGLNYRIFYFFLQIYNNIQFIIFNSPENIYITLMNLKKKK